MFWAVNTQSWERFSLFTLGIDTIHAVPCTTSQDGSRSPVTGENSDVTVSAGYYYGVNISQIIFWSTRTSSTHIQKMWILYLIRLVIPLTPWAILVIIHYSGKTSINIFMPVSELVHFREVRFKYCDFPKLPFIGKKIVGRNFSLSPIITIENTGF